MYTDEDLKNLSPEEKKRQKNSIQMEMVILESDGKKIIGEKSTLEMEIRRLRQDMERLRIDLDQKQERYDKINFEISQNEEGVKRLRKRLNFLT